MNDAHNVVDELFNLMEKHGINYFRAGLGDNETDWEIGFISTDGRWYWSTGKTKEEAAERFKRYFSRG